MKRLSSLRVPSSLTLNLSLVARLYLLASLKLQVVPITLTVKCSTITLTVARRQALCVIQVSHLSTSLRNAVNSTNRKYSRERRMLQTMEFLLCSQSLELALMDKNALPRSGTQLMHLTLDLLPGPTGNTSHSVTSQQLVAPKKACSMQMERLKILSSEKLPELMLMLLKEHLKWCSSKLRMQVSKLALPWISMSEVWLRFMRTRTCSIVMATSSLLLTKAIS